jgi:hypothetical protein
MDKLAGKVAVITGGMGGIGHESGNLRGGIVHPANDAIDLTWYAAAVNGTLAHHRPAFVAASGENGTPDIGPKGACTSLTPVTWRIWSTPAVAISPTSGLPQSAADRALTCAEWKGSQRWTRNSGWHEPRLGPKY